MSDILFSPIGKTDPISHERDGSLLHICRHYHPELVVLYLSKGMLAYQKRDDRYRASLRLLAKEADFPMEIRTVERPELTNVHLFDTFYADFEKVLRELHQANPKHRILINLSSGTPSMKGALEVLTTLLDFPVVGIQVSDPNQGQVSRRDDPDDFDLELYWACDLDRKPETYQDRTHELKSENLRGKLQRQALEAHLDAWDYHAAWQVGQQMGDLLPDAARDLLDAACLRTQQEWRRIRPELQKKLIPKASGDEEKKIFEYLLWLQNRHRQRDFADFLRGITPSLYHLSLYAVCHIARFPIADYCNGDWLDPAALKRDPFGTDIYELLEQSYGQPLRAGFLGSDQCCRILEYKVPTHPCVKPLTELREVEKNVRNIAAHTIVPITESLCRQKCGKTPAEIMELLQKTAQAVFGKEQMRWDSYDVMNRHIKAALAQ